MSQGRRRSPLPLDWLHIRNKVLKRDDYTCQLNYRGCTGRATEVDHMAGEDNHSLEALQSACNKCHATKTGREANRSRQQKYDRSRPKAPHPGLIR